ncbi:MAG TPA: efflux transporter outer membrane subunit [Usitatibacteraceae bacterium]|nr:efflux transporter outer membrane subunit [Usitatibacteraceae bacterium]
MNRITRMPIALAAALLASACATLEPALPEAIPSIPAQWPSSSTVATAPATPITGIADVGWRDFFVDPRLAQLIARSLENNRDLRVAVLNVERARGLYRIQRAARVPSVGVAGTLTRSGGDHRDVNDAYAVSLGITEFELDLFGRVRNLSQAALEQYFAQEEARRSAQLSLVAEVANAYLTLAADQELMRVAQATREIEDAAYRLTQKRHEIGAVSGLELNQARLSVETARADAARFAGQVAKDANALALLVGAPVEPDLLPEDFDRHLSGLQALPAGLPSEVLLRRPDVLQAEHALRAANANIGAARAAFFPSIRLTGAVGTASDELSGLFRSGSFAWSVLPRIDVPIFQGGRLVANLDVARADRDIALALYEKSIQAGFREAADALSLVGTLAEQRLAQESLLDAASQADRLSRSRYEAGRDSYLVLLDAQRTLYAARQGLVATRLAEQANRVTLYKVLGGGWKERNP